MSVTAAALRELHRIHQRLADLRDRLERGPKQVRAREANVVQLEARLAEARDRAKQTQVALDRKQLDLKSGEQKVVDLRVKLNGASSNREYQALLEQIAAAEMAGSVLSDEILEGLEKIDQLHAATKEAEKTLAAGKAEMEKAKQAVAASASTIHADLAQLEVELVNAEKALPPDLKADYDRVVRSKGADSLAAADDGVCTGCGQQITLNMQNELRLNKLVFCKACGRLLYLPEETSGTVAAGTGNDRAQCPPSITSARRSSSPVAPTSKRDHGVKTRQTEEHHKINAFVQSGRRTVAQLVAYSDYSGLAAWIGDRVNRGLWKIKGVSPNGGGCDKRGLNTELGKHIIDNYPKTEIEVITESQTWSFLRSSDP